MHHDVNEMTLGPSPETSAEVGLMAQGRDTTIDVNMYITTLRCFAMMSTQVFGSSLLFPIKVIFSLRAVLHTIPSRSSQPISLDLTRLRARTVVFVPPEQRRLCLPLAFWAILS
jgi:hypothetical protein